MRRMTSVAPALGNRTTFRDPTPTSTTQQPAHESHVPMQRVMPDDAVPVSPRTSRPELRVASSVRAPSAPRADGRSRRRVLDRLPVLLLLADLGAIGLTVVLTNTPLLLGQLLAVGALAVFQARHLYRPRVTLSLFDDVVALSGGVMVGIVFGLVTYRAGGGVWSWSQSFVLALATGSAVILVRAALYAGIRAARRRGLVSHPTLIVGTDATAARLAAALEEHPEHGLRVAGFIGKTDQSTPHRVRRAVLAPDSSTLPVVARQHQAGVVLMTFSGADADEVLRSLRVWGPPGGLTIFLVPPLFQMLHGGAFDRVRDIVLIPLRATVSRRLAWQAKALFDTTVAAALLLLLAPVLLMVAAAVRWETGPGVLFRQTRVGLGGRTFTLYKFRSMRPASEAEAAQHWSVADDDRLGRVGRFIRRASLDELPQLFNVVRGEMSLVGPRPERPYFVEQFGDEFDGYALRHRVRPGLTGWAAVNGLRGDTSIQERAYFDNVYIDNWSLHFDFKILAMTVLAVVKGTGA